MKQNHLFLCVALAASCLAGIQNTFAQQCWVIPGGNPFHTGLHHIFRTTLFANLSIQEVVWLEDGRVAVGYTGYTGGTPKRGMIQLFEKVHTTVFAIASGVLPPSDADAFSFFGTHLATSGNFLAATYHLTNDTWAVAIYETTNTPFALRAIVQADNPVAGDDFGNDLAMSGNWLAIAHIGATGGFHMFRRDNAGLWERRNLLHLPGVSVGLTNNSVVLALRGDLFAVGQPNEGASNSSFPGRVHLWRLQTNDTWAFEATLAVTNGVAQDRFGFSLALAHDQVFVGAPQRDDGVEDSGALYIFKRIGGTWQPTDKIRLPNPREDGNFGYNVDHSDAGDYLCVGDLRGIHQYRLENNQWVRVGRNGGGNAFYNWHTTATNTQNYLYGTTNSRPEYPTQRGRQIIARFNGRVSLLEQTTTTIIMERITNSCFHVPLGYVGLGPGTAEVPDLDQDRIGDFEEGYHGTLFDPNNVVPGGLSPIPAPGGSIAIQWPRVIDTNLVVQAEPQWSSDLQTWSTNGIVVQNLGMDPAGTEREILQATLPPSPGSSAFFRLRFSIPPGEIDE
jgi:hypothetical protein